MGVDGRRGKGRQPTPAPAAATCQRAARHEASAATRPGGVWSLDGVGGGVRGGAEVRRELADLNLTPAGTATRPATTRSDAGNPHHPAAATRTARNKPFL